MPQDTVVDPKLIVIRRETRQRQENIAEVEDLKASIKARGIINPITVRIVEGEIVLMAGERRLKASLELNLPTVPIRFFENLSEEEAEAIELEENAKRKDLHWRDNVRAVGRLHALYKAKDANWTVSQTCHEISIHQTHFHKIMKVYENLDSARISHVESIEQAYNTLARFAERKAESIVSNIIANGASIFEDALAEATSADDFTIMSAISVAQDRQQAVGEASGAVLHFHHESDTYFYAESFQVGDGLVEDVTTQAVHIEEAHSRGVLPPAPTGLAGGAAAPPPTSDPVICANFLEWAKAYEGPKFTLIHCDFPYGNYRGDDSRGAQSGTETEDFYDNHESIYWDLLDGLTSNLDRIMSYSAHLVFWFNMNFYTETVSKLRAAGLFVHDHPLIWHKTPGGGGIGVVPGTAVTYPRRTYDTALLAVRGKRPLAKPGMNSYAAPTVGNKIHPSQKPEPMLRHFLSMVVDETTSVLDPTCGSAAALRAAEDLGAARVLGLELDKNYAATANDRTKQARVMRLAGMSLRGE